MNGATTSLEVHECTQCGTTLFPARYFCPACGGKNWLARTTQTGVVMEATVVRHRAGEGEGGASPLHLASVRTQAGPVVIARMEMPLADETLVSLAVDALHRIVAHPIDTTGLAGDHHVDQ
ncbi:hypothetical protein F4827_002272 [Paraburkholderia bannensis]|uniref:ChsH2 rubredoxin-like zinc ribbon domain-containing protein n=1 Tax=Paraburkholderia bannensis TaxID=765414 RepID=A0A7W9TVY3_9BURK|nr:MULTISPECIES: zinc ribbon domain-containing protein [Paraburkholderia]MBB3257181.1 hypothetical protein [Paraburkholderia sp. WP4_3_2]MBB6102423.1 hypothetical protein [Paraburkholderia bannensis]